MALSLDELKKEIMRRARSKEICSDFQNILLAKSYLEILEAGKKFPTWVWSSNIMDVELLKEFPTEDLLRANIYVGLRYKLENVKDVIYILPGAYISLQCSADSKCEIMCLGGSLEVNLLEKSFAKIKGFFDAEINVVAMDNSISSINLTNQSKLTYRSDKETNSNIIMNSNSQCFIESHGMSYINLKAIDKSEINYKSFEDSEIKIRMASTVKINQSQDESKL